MCGIAGILTQQRDRTDTAQRVAAMQATLHHRGPDDHGSYQSTSTPTTLSHTRLSIIDLSSAGHQPMPSSDHRYWITFNGEIYNYQQLKASLEQRGETFVSDSDTEVILKLYTKLGPDCVNQLRGMFAFMIWDEVEQIGFAARDPLGIKPFYYVQHGNELGFASELQALLASGLSDQSLDTEGLESYLQRGAVSEPNTLVNDIKMLEAGSCLNWQNSQTSAKRYWSLNFKPSSATASDAITLTRNALEGSIAAHFVSDVPVGIFLSGGIDSTALVALAKQVTNKPINTYSIAFEDPAWNEGDIARRVADHFGTNHTELVMTASKAKPLFKSFLEAVDQPSIDGFNTYCVAKMAHDNGEKVVLSGLGADELFGGYKSFQVLPKTLRTSHRLRFLSPLLRAIAAPLNRILPSRLRRALDLILQPTSLRQAHQSLRGIFSNAETTALCNSIGINSNRSTQQPINNSLPLADAISELELSLYMRNQLLRDSDVMSMAWSLELRVPFVDQPLIDTLSSIPSEIRLQQGKKLLTDAVPEIPDWVKNRPKQGFRFPFDEWFSSEWHDMGLSKKTPGWIKLTPWYRRWSLILLKHWSKKHLQKELF